MIENSLSRRNLVGNDKIHIFIDTNIFISSSYNFQEGKLATIRRYCNEGLIELVISSVVQREVEEHIKRDLEECYEKISKHLISERRLNFLRNEPTFLQVLRLLSSQGFVDKVTHGFSKYLKETDCKILDTTFVKIEDVLADLFNMKPPFESKKQNEFKDSIIIYSLIEFQKSIASNVWIASEDKGFCRALESNPGFTVFSSLEQLLNKVNEIVKADQFIGIKDFFSNEMDPHTILDRIEEKILEAKIALSRDYYEDLEVIEISDVMYRLFSIEEIENEFAEVSLEAECKLRISYTFFDEENSVYDTIDHEYSYQHIGEIEEQHVVRFPFNIGLSIDKEKMVISSFEIDELYGPISLGDDTLLERERIDDVPDLYQPDEEWIGYTTCPNCGEHISFENDGLNGFCDKCTPQ